MGEWQNRRVLVTGGTGFIGSHVVQALLAEGARVRVLAHYNGSGHLGNLAELPPRERAEVEVVWGDLRDADSVRRAVKGMERVLHLGALISIPYSYLDPRSYVDVNVTGTLNVLWPAATWAWSGWCTPPPARFTARRTRCRSPRPTRSGGSRRIRQQDRGRQAGRELFLLLQPAGGDPAPLQRLRAAPVHPCPDPDHPHPGTLGAGDPAGEPLAAAGLHLRDRHGAGLPEGGQRAGG